MVIDTSALVAILLEEAPRQEFLTKIVENQPIMAAPNALEVHMVMAKYYGREMQRTVQQKLREFGIAVVPFTTAHAEEAARAFDRFGKGRHPAGLNFGDCIAYALAKVSGQPLLFTGDDFGRTDVQVA